MPIRIGILDDHAVVIDGVRAAVDREPDIEFVLAATDSNELLRGLSGTTADLLLLDVRIGDQQTFSLCADIVARFPKLRVMMFSGTGDTSLLRRALRAGAVGYILKDASTAELPHTIRECMRHGTYFDPHLAGTALLETLRSPAESEDEDLSERELAIMRMIADGQTNDQIGHALNLSVHTVKVEVSRLLRRFEVRRRSELVKETYRRGLV